MNEFDKLAINTLKMNGVAAINKANSGHPGIVLGAATMLHTLFTRHLVYDPKNPKWINRDRFILSAGHGSALLYSMLRILGHISEDDLRNFRQLDSLTPGHPEYGHTVGVESTTGPLGQGLATAVGIAMGEAHLNSKFKEIDHHTYVIVGDGDLQEGVANEALSLAGYQKLDKLIVLHDSNDIQLDTATDKVVSDNLSKKLKSMGWHYQLVKSNEVNKIDRAIAKAKASKKPSFIEVKTIIGDGSTKQGTSDVHGSPLGDDIKTVATHLEWKNDYFSLPKEVHNLYEETLFKRGSDGYAAFTESKDLIEFLADKQYKVELEIAQNQASRASSGNVIEYLNDNVPNFIGGSADLSGSTKALGGDGVFSPENRKGRNILFGVREFAMGAIANGLALHSNFKPFVSTFFVFSDYVKPAIRLSALMNLPVTYVFTHDSVFVGEDGPTHMPIEQLAMLRTIPNTKVIRPADEKEVKGAWEIAINSKKTPTIIVLTRQNLKTLPELKSDFNGAYQIHNASSEWSIFASGSEVANALEIGKELDINVYSVPIMNFDGIDVNRDKAISIEAGTTYGWSKIAKHNFGINQFGYSGPGAEVYKKLGLDIDSLRSKIKGLIK